MCDGGCTHATLFRYYSFCGAIVCFGGLERMYTRYQYPGPTHTSDQRCGVELPSAAHSTGVLAARFNCCT